MEGGDVGRGGKHGETRMKRRKGGGWETGKAGKGRMERRRRKRTNSRRGEGR